MEVTVAYSAPHWGGGGGRGEGGGGGREGEGGGGGGGGGRGGGGGGVVKWCRIQNLCLHNKLHWGVGLGVWCGVQVWGCGGVGVWGCGVQVWGPGVGCGVQVW